MIYTVATYSSLQGYDLLTVQPLTIAQPGKGLVDQIVGRDDEDKCD
jgi:hypothetical protein